MWRLPLHFCPFSHESTCFLYCVQHLCRTHCSLTPIAVASHMNRFGSTVSKLRMKATTTILSIPRLLKLLKRTEYRTGNNHGQYETPEQSTTWTCSWIICKTLISAQQRADVNKRRVMNTRISTFINWPTRIAGMLWRCRQLVNWIMNIYQVGFKSMDLMHSPNRCYASSLCCCTLIVPG